MFHKRSGQIPAILLLISVSSQPLIAHAGESAALVVPDTSVSADQSIAPRVKNFSLDALRHDTKVTLSKTQRWVKDKTHRPDYENPVKILEVKIDRFQDRVKPAGRNMKASLQSHIPGQGLAQTGDRMFSVFGLLLMAAFGTVVLLMSLASPMSRLGGRH